YEILADWSSDVCSSDLNCRAVLFSILTWFLASGPGWGQAPVKMLPAKAGTLANLVTVPIPSASCVALGETAGCLAFGHEKPYPQIGRASCRERVEGAAG